MLFSAAKIVEEEVGDLYSVLCSITKRVCTGTTGVCNLVLLRL